MPLVVSLDAAVCPEIVPGRVGIELVELEATGSIDDAEPVQRHRSNNRALATADGTIAAPRIDDPVREVKPQLHRAALTRGPVRGLYGYPNTFPAHVRRSPTRCPSRIQRDDCTTEKRRSGKERVGKEEHG